MPGTTTPLALDLPLTSANGKPVPPVTDLPQSTATTRGRVSGLPQFDIRPLPTRGGKPAPPVTDLPQSTATTRPRVPGLPQFDTRPLPTRGGEEAPSKASKPVVTPAAKPTAKATEAKTTPAATPNAPAPLPSWLVPLLGAGVGAGAGYLADSLLTKDKKKRHPRLAALMGGAAGGVLGYGFQPQLSAALQSQIGNVKSLMAGSTNNKNKATQAAGGNSYAGARTPKRLATDAAVGAGVGGGTYAWAERARSKKLMRQVSKARTQADVAAKASRALKKKLAKTPADKALQQERDAAKRLYKTEHRALTSAERAAGRRSLRPAVKGLGAGLIAAFLTDYFTQMTPAQRQALVSKQLGLN